MFLSRFGTWLLIPLLLGCSLSASADTAFSSAHFTLNGKDYLLAIADTDAKKLQGLMFQSSLGDGQGMLFVYDRPAYLNIWMKNTLIPLTVLWLDQQAQLIDKKLLYPCRRRDCPSFGPEQPSQFVVELGQNEFDRFQVGDSLSAIKAWHDQR